MSVLNGICMIRSFVPTSAAKTKLAVLAAVSSATAPSVLAAVQTGRFPATVPGAVRAMTDATSGSDSGESTSKRRIRIYTRTGDKGTSSLYTGERRPKDDHIFEALGTTDELSSVLGLAREYCREANNGIAPKIDKIQSLLQDIGSNIATPRIHASGIRLARTEFDTDGALTVELETWIDELDETLPPLSNFILPSGGKAASALHMARSVCRRAERRLVPLVQDGFADTSTSKYLNRLSDYLFTAARAAAAIDGHPEIIYKKF